MLTRRGIQHIESRMSAFKEAGHPAFLFSKQNVESFTCLMTRIKGTSQQQKHAHEMVLALVCCPQGLYDGTVLIE